MKPARSLAARLVAIAALQILLLAIVAVVIWWFTAPHGPHGHTAHGPPPGPPHGPPTFGPLLTLVCSAAILALGALITARWIVRPIRQLTRTVNALGAGDLAVRSRLDRADEIGELGHRFDDMAVRIERLLVSEKELLANVAHELRTPLARIGVALDLASEGNSERARASLTEIAVDVAELEKIVDDILTAMRFEVGGPGTSLPLRRTRLAPEVIATAAAERMAARHPERPLDVSIAPDLPEIEVDAVLFRRVIDNLLVNAHKYTPDGTSPIGLAVARAGDAVVFEIADRGIGLSPDEQEHMFDPFWRSERSRSRATGGVGLGLTLVKRIVDAHGGGVSVTSEVGEGTTARISVPIS